MCINDFRTVDHEVLRVGVVAAAVVVIQWPRGRVPAPAGEEHIDMQATLRPNQIRGERSHKWPA